MQLHWNVFIVLILIGGMNRVSGWTEVDIVRVESTVSPSKVVNYDFHVSKVNRTTCVVSGNLEILIDSTEANAYRVKYSSFSVQL